MVESPQINNIAQDYQEGSTDLSGTALQLVVPGFVKNFGTSNSSLDVPPPSPCLASSGLFEITSRKPPIPTVVKIKKNGEPKLGWTAKSFLARCMYSLVVSSAV